MVKGDFLRVEGQLATVVKVEAHANNELGGLVLVQFQGVGDELWVSLDEDGTWVRDDTGEEVQVGWQ